MTLYVNPFMFAGASPHNYWRIRPSGWRDTFFEIRELEFRGSPGGANLAAGGSAIGSGWTNPHHAFDGNAGTWAARYSQDTEGAIVGIGYSFPSVVDINAVSIQATATPTRAIICAFLDWSDDGSAWTTRDHMISSSEYVSGEAREFTMAPIATDRASARLWGVEITANNGGGNTRVGEIEFRASAAGADLCIGGFAGGNRSALGLTVQAFNAFDDNTATRAGIVRPGKLHYNFASAPNPTHYAIRAPSGFAATDAPRDWSVYYSLDGLTWTTVATVTGQTGWSNSEIRVFAL